jgi:hypothetical protein
METERLAGALTLALTLLNSTAQGKTNAIGHGRPDRSIRSLSVLDVTGNIVERRVSASIPFKAPDHDCLDQRLHHLQDL